MLDQSSKAGPSGQEVKMIRNVFQLKDIGRRLQTPRIYMFSLDCNQHLRQAKGTPFKSNTRVSLMYEGTLDNIIGILYKTKALTALAGKGHTEMKLRDIAQPALFIPHEIRGRPHEAVPVGQAPHGDRGEQVREWRWGSSPWKICWKRWSARSSMNWTSRKVNQADREEPNPGCMDAPS
ncbi:MAG: hypothetical protein IPL14_17775 [Nitrospira sp.]|nr:hypothetical protein [Nitrospira sp.]